MHYSPDCCSWTPESDGTEEEMLNTINSIPTFLGHLNSRLLGQQPTLTLAYILFSINHYSRKDKCTYVDCGLLKLVRAQECRNICSSLNKRTRIDCYNIDHWCPHCHAKYNTVYTHPLLLLLFIDSSGSPLLLSLVTGDSWLIMPLPAPRPPSVIIEECDNLFRGLATGTSSSPAIPFPLLSTSSLSP